MATTNGDIAETRNLNRSDRRRLRFKPAAEYAQITERQLRALKDRGLIAHYVVGGLIFFDVEDLDRFIESCRRPAAS